MRRGAFKIKAVAAPQMVLLAGQRDLQFSAQYEQELFALVGIRLAAARFWFDSKKMRLHYFVAPGEQFHANTGAGFEHLALGWAYQSGIRFRRIEKIKDVGAIVAC